MKNKARKIERLNQELIKYSEQIGILDDEIPLLVFSVKEWNEKCKHEDTKFIRKSKRAYGWCSYSERLICIRVNDYRMDLPMKTLIHGLIHELVHYRWQWLPHGKKFEERIKEIKKGRSWLYKEVKMRVEIKE